MGRNEVDVGAVLASSVIAALNGLAPDQSPPALHWRFVRYQDVVVVEGRPTGVDGIRACERWARILGMSQYSNEPHDVRAWFLNDGEWALEIIEEPLTDGAALARSVSR